MNPVRYLPRFRRAYEELEVLTARAKGSRQAMEAYQLEQLNELWKHAAEHTPYYRQLAGRLYLPSRFASIAEFQSLVPTLDKSTIARRGHELLSSAAGPGHWHRTSGSTGTPIQVFRSHEDHQAMLRAKYCFYNSWGADIFDRMAWLWSSVDTRRPFARPIQRVQDRLRRRLRLSASRLDPASLRDGLRRMAAFEPVGLYGFSQAVYLLAMEARNVSFECESLRFICMTGESATHRMKAAVESALGAPAIMEYGSVECGFLAGEDHSRTLRVRADLSIIETLPRPDGLFDVVVTVLTNRSFPLLRYRIGDVTDHPIVHPDEGLPILQSVCGRNDDVLVSRAGAVIHATAVDEIFEDLKQPVLHYRVHQHRDGDVAVQVVPLRPTDQLDLASIGERLSHLLAGYPADVQTADAISQTRAGKHRLVTSDLAHTRTLTDVRS